MSSWKVPLFDLTLTHQERQSVDDVLASGWLTMGPITDSFEEKFASFHGIGIRAIALSSCTAALHLGLLAAGIGRGDEVVIPALTFVAAPNVVTLTGALPVLADSTSESDWNVSADTLAKVVTPRTKAIMIVHFAGMPCDMAPIVAYAREKKLLLIEDVAHAVGATYGENRCGTFGDMGCFSFFSNKNMSTGEGGMLITSNEEIEHNVRSLRSHGMTSLTVERHQGKTISYDVVQPGLNYRMDEVRAALGISQLAFLEERNRQRHSLVNYYYEQLTDCLVKIPWRAAPSNRTSSYHIFPVLLPERSDRSKIMASMAAQGVQTSIHYPSFQKFSAYKTFFTQPKPIADKISRLVLTLPLYPAMTNKQLDTVVAALKGALDGK